VYIAQSLAVSGYAAQTARSHELPAWLVAIVGGVARLLGIDAATTDSVVALHSVRQVHRLAATWELLLDPVTLSFFVGGIVLLAVVVWNAMPRGDRWSGWLRAVRVLALTMALWLPIRLALMISLYLHRAIRAEVGDVLTVMNQFLNPWVHLALLACPVSLAWWFVRLQADDAAGNPAEDDGAEENGPGRRSTSREDDKISRPNRSLLIAVALGILGAGIVAFIGQWDPVGRRKTGRVMFVEKHSTWEPTDRPYDTDHFGHDPSYSYTLIYNYCSHFYDMSRLMESDEIRPERLSQCDVLVVKIPTARFSDDEVAAITGFVERGGGLLLVGDHTNVFDSSTYLNDICRPLGFTFRNDLLFCIGSAYEQVVRPSVVPHPAIQHVPTMNYAVSCSIDPGSSLGRAVARNAGLWSLPPDYHADNYHPQAEYRPEMHYGSFIQLWATRHGKGRVLAFTDSTIFSNFCVFQPGKAELMVGMLEWLNHTSVLDRDGYRITLVILTGAIGLALLAGGLLLARQHRVAWVVMLSAATLGTTLGSVAAAAVHLSGLPEPEQKADRPMTRVVIDRTVSEVPLSLGAFTQGDGDGYGLLEQWISRLGYFTMRRSGRQAFTGDALVIIGPTRSVSREYREELVEYVNGGGRVLVMDWPGSDGTTANSLLWPFGLVSDHSAGKEGLLAIKDGWPGMELTGCCAILGGEPFLWVDDTPVGARVAYGKGSVMAIGIGSVFDDTVMGDSWMTEPDADLLTIFDLLFAIVRGAVEDKPVVSPPPSEPAAEEQSEPEAAR
jgi:hypothetical protein